MSNHQYTNTPSLVTDYFADRPDEPVSLVQVFSWGGWQPLTVPQEASWSNVLYFADQGVTNVAFQVGNSVADFSVEELLAYARQGMFSRPAYANRQPVL